MPPLERYFLEAFAFETVTVASASATAALTNNTFSPRDRDVLPVKKALVYVGSTNAIRFRIDGGSASSTSGHHILINTSIELYGYTQIDNFSCVSFTSGTTAEITVTYLR